jgi:D-alanyl-D-alanine carboxypeptidase/D-alanyl-D-alanine-endopeptidase (penicillin-binding protein 4)
MTNRFRSATFSTAMVLIAGCAGATAAPGPAPAAPAAMTVAQFARSVDSMVLAPAFRNAHWGVMIVDPTSGDTIYSHNAGKLFMPASNQKLLTGATALTQLGPDYRFSTTFASNGIIASGVLTGDLIVQPTGDPTLADTMWRGDHRNAFRAIADSLRARGVTSIAGGLVRGATPFPDQMCGFGWELDDLDEAYGACIQDLFVNEGVRRVPRGRTPSDTAMVSAAIRDPRGAYFSALSTALNERGILLGAVVDTNRVAPKEGATPIFTMWSPPLSAIMAQMMKPSQNQVAEILLKTLGRERAGVGRADSGRRVVERQLVAWGADSVEFAVRDGSGMSRHDYVSPRTLIRVLETMRKSPHFDVWYASLPISGVDGTLRTRMRGTAAERRVHAKTGTVDKARSLSGYVTTADGRMLLFSFLCNNFTTPTRDVEQVQDAILVMLASRPRPAKP